MLKITSMTNTTTPEFGSVDTAPHQAPGQLGRSHIDFALVITQSELNQGHIQKSRNPQRPPHGTLVSREPRDHLGSGVRGDQ